MSLLQETIKKDMVQAMKDKNELSKKVLRMMMSEVRNAEIDKPDHNLTDEDVLKVIARLEKQRKDSIKQYIAGGRQDLADAETEELSVILKYLPEKMSEVELREIVKNIVSKADSKEFGVVMRLVMQEVKGKADGNLVRELVEEYLS